MAHIKQYTNPKTGQKYPIGGCIVSHRPSDLPVLAAASFSSKNLPPSVDLRGNMTPVEHQGQSNSCSANALAGAYEYLIKRNKKKNVDASRLFIYFNGRLKDGQNPNAMQDIGCTLPSAVAGMQEYGCCSEAVWKYYLTSINRKPSFESYSKGKRYRVKDAVEIPTHLLAMKSCLADGYPFIFALHLFESFHKAATNKGRVPMPGAFEAQSADHGWHAMVAAGYSDRSHCFIVRNSWGPDWGDNGYCYIPYAYMANPNHCMNIHVIRKLSSIKPQLPQKCAAFKPNQSQLEINNKPFKQQSHDDDDDDDDDDLDSAFDCKQFWRQKDTYNFYLGTELINDPNNFTVKKKYNGIANASTPFIIWIDTKSDLKDTIERKLKATHNVEFEFCQTFSQGTDYVLQYNDQIRSSKYQIVCRGYYPDENKNPLDLLDFLIDLQLNHLPILVITQHKADIISHFNIQASEMDLHIWKDRIFITDDTDRLLKELKQNIDQKKGSNIP